MNKPLKEYMDGGGDTPGSVATPIIKNGALAGSKGGLNGHGPGTGNGQANGKKPGVSLVSNGAPNGHAAKVAGSKEGISGSENSLLTMTDEDEYLKRGMDEDGSFREGHYGH